VISITAENREALLPFTRYSFVNQWLFFSFVLVVTCCTGKHNSKEIYY